MKNIRIAKNVSSLLRLVISSQETSAPFNQFTLPIQHLRKITTLSLFPPKLKNSQSSQIINAGGSVVEFFKKLREIVATGTVDLIHAHSVHVALLATLAKLRIGAKRFPPIVLTVHCSYPNLKRRNRVLFLLSVPFMDRVVFCSKASMESFPLFYHWLCGSSRLYITNGVNVSRVQAVLEQNPSQRDENRFVICAVGLMEVKDPLTILKAFEEANISDGELVFLGDGDMREELEAECAKRELQSRVKILGTISRDEVYSQMKRASLFISASSSEGLPIAPLEAMLCSCPVILSDIPAHRELIDSATQDSIFDV